MLVFSVVFVVSILIFFVIYCYLNRSRYSSSLNFIEEFGLIAILFSITLAVIVSFSVSYAVDSKSTYECEILETTDIYTVSDNININSSFILGSGTVNNNTCYYYYERVNCDRHHNSDEIYKLGHIMANNAHIVYITDNSAPRIEKHLHYTTNHSVFLDKFVSCTSCGIFDTEIYYIYLPENSIIQSFVLDSE